jgi:hypothetical protein
MSNSVFTPNPNPVNAGYAQSPFSNDNLNPNGSNYADTFTKDTTDLIAKAIEYQIYDAAPQQYDALKVLNASPYVDKPSDEFSYFEKTFGRSAMTCHAWNAGTATITLSGTYATSQSIPVAVGDVIYNEDGTPVIVTTITPNVAANSATLVVAAQTGGALPTFANGQTISFATTLIADAMDVFKHYDRPDVVERYNYIQFFQRNSRWGAVEMQKMINMGTTDYMNIDKTEKLDQLRVDMFSMYINGTRGEFPIAGEGGTTSYAKMMGGIYPTMIAAGAPAVSAAVSGLKTAFETLAFETNFKKEGGVRMVYGTDEKLYELSKVYKEDKVRYEPNSKIADLNLYQYNIGNMKFVPVSCELFRDDSVLPPAFKDRLIVVDQESIKPVKFKGMPQIQVGQTNNMQRGSYRNYTDWWVQANLSMQFNNPQGGFIIDIS